MSQTLTRSDQVAHGLAPGLVAGARIVLCDLDGCLVSEGSIYEDTADFVHACGDRLWIVSNNSGHSAQDMSAELAGMGLSIPAARILLAGEQTLRHLSQERPAASMALFADEPLEREARRLGFVLDAPKADIVLLCRDQRFSLARLNLLAESVFQGAEFWVANTDTTHPGKRGQPVAETGALLAALQAIVGDRKVHSIGKPATKMAETALEKAGLTAAAAVFLGDNPATDGALARATGMRFVRLQRSGARA